MHTGLQHSVCSSVPCNELPNIRKFTKTELLFVAFRVCRLPYNGCPNIKTYTKMLIFQAFRLCLSALQHVAKHETDIKIRLLGQFDVSQPALQHIAKSQKSYQNDVIYTMSCGPTCLATHSQKYQKPASNGHSHSHTTQFVDNIRSIPLVSACLAAIAQRSRFIQKCFYYSIQSVSAFFATRR